MSSADGFIKAIIEDPDDDALRLIYADWLDERGDPRGQFIRVQCRLAALPPDDPGRFELEEEEHDLLKAHQEEWAAPYRGVVEEWGFARGLVERVKLTADTLLSRGDALFGQHPVRDILLEGEENSVEAVSNCSLLSRIEKLEIVGYLGLSTLGFQSLVASPYLGRLRSLSVAQEWPGLRFLFESPLMARLRSLDLRQSSITDHALRALASTPTVSALQTLRLRQPNCTWRGVVDLLTSPCLTNLSTLEMPNSNRLAVGVDRVELFARPEAKSLLARLTSLDLTSHDVRVRGLKSLLFHLRNIQHLCLNNCHLDKTAGEMIAEAPSLATLRRLHLDNNTLRDTGVKALAASPHLTSLTTLSLRKNEIGGPGIAALADSPNFANLTALDLSDNYVGHTNLKALLKSPHLTQLRRLSLAQNRLQREAIQALVESELLAQLTDLDLSGNPIGDSGIRLLVSSPSLKRLRSLRLAGAAVGDEGVNALITSPYLRRLERLELRNEAAASEQSRQRLHDRFGKALEIVGLT
jgi:uncharacterized protein (TIGR02996 family)